MDSPPLICNGKEGRKDMKWSKLSTLLVLHIMLLIYSLSGICSKLAAAEPVFSFKFCMYYAIVIGLLGVYAIGWQQVIKHLPLTTAFANKAITILWALVWGILFFHEGITVGKIVGIVFVILGVILFACADEVKENE